jgi:hypothetical protein
MKRFDHGSASALLHGLTRAATHSGQLGKQSMRINDRPETIPNDGERPKIHGSRIGPRGKTDADLNLKARAKD